MNPNLSITETAHPWILGTYAVYAQNIHIARRVYEHLSSLSDSGPFGTVELETGEMVDWVDMHYGDFSPRQGIQMQPECRRDAH